MIYFAYDVTKTDEPMASIAPRSWTNNDGKVSTRHRVTFVDVAGKRARRDFEKKVDAKRFVESLSQVRAEARAVPPAPPPEPPKPVPVGISFANAAQAYLEACRVGRDGGDPIERSTYDLYRGGINNHVIPMIGEKLLPALVPRDMREFRDALQASGKSKRVVSLCMFLTKAVISHSIQEEWIDIDPTSAVKLKRSRRLTAPEANRVRIHTRAEMTAILEAAHRMTLRHNPQRKAMESWRRFEPMLHTLVFTGLRMSELRGLPCDAVDLDSGIIKVYQRADLFAQIGPPKSRYGYRTIHIPKDLTERLRGWLGDRVTGLVFPTSVGTPVSHTNIYRRMWHPVLKEAGVTPLNPHSTRHFFASLLIHQGVRMKVLQEVMGHHDPMFTMKVYGHLFTDPEDIALRQEMAERMQHTLIGDDADED